MSNLHNPFAFDILGNPIAPRQGTVRPKLLVMGEQPLSRLQGRMAKRAFTQFCMTSRASFVPNPTEIGKLPDGTPYQITRVNGVDQMRVWPGLGIGALGRDDGGNGGGIEVCGPMPEYPELPPLYRVTSHSTVGFIVPSHRTNTEGSYLDTSPPATPDNPAVVKVYSYGVEGYWGDETRYGNSRSLFGAVLKGDDIIYGPVLMASGSYISDEGVDTYNSYPSAVFSDIVAGSYLVTVHPYHGTTTSEISTGYIPAYTVNIGDQIIHPFTTATGTMPVLERTPVDFSGLLAIESAAYAADLAKERESEEARAEIIAEYVDRLNAWKRCMGIPVD